MPNDDIENENSDSDIENDELNDLLNDKNKDLNMGIEGMLKKLHINNNFVSSDVKKLLKGIKF